MTAYRDLESCDYFDTASDDPMFSRTWSDSLKAVGWLGSKDDFPTGAPSPEVVDALATLLRDVWQPAMFLGWHDCELCLRADALAGQKAGAGAKVDYSRTGTRNLFVPGDGFVFVAPELIRHYIAVHHYQPPASFCEAVLACPPMKSTAYFAALRRNAAGDFAKSVERATQFPPGTPRSSLP